MKKYVIIEGERFTFETTEDVKIDFSLLERKDDISLYRIRFDWGKRTFPKPIKLSYEILAVDVYYMWDALNKLRNLSFGFRDTESRLAWGMPLKSLVSRDNRNTYLVSLSDVKTPITIRMRGNQAAPTIPVEIEFFTMLTGPFASYETVLRIDCRHIPFDEAIRDTGKWFADLGYQNRYVPDAARLPMYSTWYSYTQSISAESALAECREAVKYGMDTVIIDDGWHTQSYESMYGYCGDWRPDEKKFPDMKAFVDELHAIGMKAMLWYATPFMGKFAQKCRDFEGMFLDYSEKTGSYVLDPRYREVRRYLIEVFSHAVRDWGFDGLKLDFINCFKTNGESNERMDVVSVEDATELLLREIRDALSAINPEVMIEFRQPYFGPIISTYGNMMRVWDCPLDSATNRTQSLNLRMVAGDCAVHSDMMYWHPEDSAENVAIQLWGTLLSVPQISARMHEISPTQQRVLKHYLDFWRTHRDTLMKGDLSVTLCENGYGTASVMESEERITMLISSPLYEVDDVKKRAYAVNLTDQGRMIVKNPTQKRVACSIWDCEGNRIADDVVLRDALTELALPMAGLLCMEIE